MKKEVLEQIMEWVDRLSRDYQKVNAELVGWQEDGTAYYFTVKIPKSLEMEKKKQEE